MTWQELKAAAALAETRHGVALDEGVIAAPDETFGWWTIATNIGTPDALLYLLDEAT